MKFDLNNASQVFFIFTFFISLIYCITYSLKQIIKKYNFKLIKQIRSIHLMYSKKMTKVNYVSFEKYQIWRFCVIF